MEHGGLLKNVRTGGGDRLEAHDADAASAPMDQARPKASPEVGAGSPAIARQLLLRREAGKAGGRSLAFPPASRSALVLRAPACHSRPLLQVIHLLPLAPLPSSAAHLPTSASPRRCTASINVRFFNNVSVRKLVLLHLLQRGALKQSIPCIMHECLHYPIHARGVQRESCQTSQAARDTRREDVRPHAGDAMRADCCPGPPFRASLSSVTRHRRFYILRPEHSLMRQDSRLAIAISHPT